MSRSLRFDESKTQRLDERQSILPGAEETCKSAARQIHRLPLELLMGIFSLCLPDKQFVSPLPTCAPLLLIQICRSWREIVLSMPSMWCSIRLDVGYDCEYSSSANLDALKFVELFDTWLERSGDCPLSVLLRVGYTSRYDNCVSWEMLEDKDHDFAWEMLGRWCHDAVYAEAATKFVALCFHHARRWQHVQLSVGLPGNVFESPFPFEMRGAVTAPMLETLSIRTIHSALRTLSRPLNTILQSAPLLRDLFVRVGEIYDSVTSNTLRPPYSQLTYLDLNTFETLRDVLDVLHSSIQLVKCSLTVGFRVRLYSSQGEELIDVVNSSLQWLSIDTEPGLRGILKHLTLPALRYLCVREKEIPFDISDGLVDYWDCSWPQEEVTSFFTRSSCLLEELVLIQLHLSKGDLIDCLQHTSPSLTNITVKDCKYVCVDDTVLARLTYHGQTSFLCPNLESIEFVGTATFSHGALADMVHSRWESSVAAETPVSPDHPAPCARPSSVIFKMKYGRNYLDDIRRLEPLQNEGLCVEVHTDHPLLDER